jgi:hypothetical protein
MPARSRDIERVEVRKTKHAVVLLHRSGKKIYEEIAIRERLDQDSHAHRQETMFA